MPDPSVAIPMGTVLNTTHRILINSPKKDHPLGCDNIFPLGEFSGFLLAKGKVDLENSGELIDWTVEYDMNGNFRWVGSGASLPHGVKDKRKNVRVDWRTLVGQVDYYADKYRKAKEQAAKLNYIKSEMKNAQKTGSWVIEKALFSAGGLPTDGPAYGSEANQIDGLDAIAPAAAATESATPAYGGHAYTSFGKDVDGNYIWVPKIDATNTTITQLLFVNGGSAIGLDNWDATVIHPECYGKFWSLLNTYERYIKPVGDVMTKKVVTFHDRPLLQSKAVTKTSSTAYDAWQVSSEYLKAVAHADANPDMYEPVMSHEFDGMFSRVVWMLNIICGGRMFIKRYTALNPAA